MRPRLFLYVSRRKKCAGTGKVQLPAEARAGFRRNFAYDSGLRDRAMLS
jgi:hypothetical protein